MYLQELGEERLILLMDIAKALVVMLGKASVEGFLCCMIE